MDQIQKIYDELDKQQLETVKNIKTFLRDCNSTIKHLKSVDFTGDADSYHALQGLIQKTEVISQLGRQMITKYFAQRVIKNRMRKIKEHEDKT